MPRPRLCRKIRLNPNVTFYKPQGIPLHSLEIIELTHEEWETLRLKYTEELNQIESAKKMETSQSTLQRILSSAQKKIGQAIVKGFAIKIIK
ncbi:MAG: hypothetical protein UR28_C0008G0004 [Candidatus Peregrinibacteria bacterium GW2011_GWF2_33_10]|nr:MAG: hypothetical protein UR28_C0008G0004 [Candidatus Peregrinibacteria bacterium GW2011_GWF2_33_10]OGJ45207.1 MAG: hypothetical protein A2263_06570 [Candidatus Peregrinibacteria bacterium RIFOXYA2_FULL_33_21]OGJ46459.1 MAG: hypothetical protein A2272_00260 [Candidatus Peregrinibacteria bacterium RIFOXYA12_FULL_33_12]OGJ51131.1 MAG: hypothetical protein A2307_04655 [Candidatus Peregrinibacteria bacterium RIFOXYB2_FULL_33_20]